MTNTTNLVWLKQSTFIISQVPGWGVQALAKWVFSTRSHKAASKVAGKVCFFWISGSYSNLTWLFIELISLSLYDWEPSLLWWSPEATLGPSSTPLCSLHKKHVTWMFASSKPARESLPPTCEQSINKAVSSHELCHALLESSHVCHALKRKGLHKSMDVGVHVRMCTLHNEVS